MVQERCFVKPIIPDQLKKVINRLDLKSTLLLMGILLDHSLKLQGLEEPTPVIVNDQPRVWLEEV